MYSKVCYDFSCVKIFEYALYGKGIIKNTEMLRVTFGLWVMAHYS